MRFLTTTVVRFTGFAYYVLLASACGGFGKSRGGDGHDDRLGEPGSALGGGQWCQAHRWRRNMR